MDSKNTKAKTNGSAQRRSGSWIESFVEWGADLETPEIFRRWGAIATVGAVLEQKAFFHHAGEIFPNLFVMLIGGPGIGKSRTIRPLREFAKSLPEFHISPDDMTGASLVDSMMEATRTLDPDLMLGVQPIHYNSLFAMVSDLQSTMHKYDQELVAKMTIFYDCDPFIQSRRTLKENKDIQSPQLSMLIGTTDSQLTETLPAGAWEQGFMSRMIMVFSEDRAMKEDFFSKKQTRTVTEKDLEHDLKAIYGLRGQFGSDDDFRRAFNTWRRGEHKPAPTHQRLRSYCSRREVHLLKLAMVSNADRGDSLCLDLHDFTRAKGWLEAAERTMPLVFERAVSLDSKLMLEVLDQINAKGVPEHTFMRMMAGKFPTNSVRRAAEIMIDAKMIEFSEGKGGMKWVRRAVHSE
jgi:Protein of unknown function (DUF3987)